MKKTCIIYGSSTGTCQAVAEKIAVKLGVDADDIIDVANISQSTPDAYSNLILGTSTWGAGELQDDWYDGLECLKKANLKDKTIALFGCGDSESYGDTFCSAIGEIYNALKYSGARFVGAVSTDGYTYDDSAAVIDGCFVGLAIDEVNEPDKTDSRICAWIDEIKDSL